MVASFCREVGKAFDSLLILESQSRPVCVYPRLELVAVCKMKPVQERPLVEADRRCPLSRAHRLLELPYVNLNQFRIEPEPSCCREYQIASQRLSDPVHRLIERVVCPRAGAFRPEVGLDRIARETLPAAPADVRPSSLAGPRRAPAQGAGGREVSTRCMTAPCSPCRWPAMQITDTPLCSTRWTSEAVHYDPPQTSHRHRHHCLCRHHS